jgi:4-hydroxybutyrate CoA-transferase
MQQLQDPLQVLSRFGTGHTVVLHSGCAEPRGLARLLAEHADAMRGVRLLTMMPMGEAPYGDLAAAALDVNTFFPGRGLRAALSAGRVRALRYPLSAIPGLFGSGAMRADVALLQVSSPDAGGHASLGVSVDYMRAVLAQSPLVIAEINPRMPHTCGDARIPLSSIDWFIDATDPPQSVAPAAADAVDERIARNVAGLVGDGAVLQMGIGSLPDRVLAQLGHLRHLGLHSGIVTDAVRPLIEGGIIDNSTKQHRRGVSVTSMAAGTQSFYDFLNDNRAIEFHPCSHTHDAGVLAGIEGLCAINSALQVDLDGDVNAEQVGIRKLSLPGGLPDFAFGATRARAGMSIIALRSTHGGERASSIVPRFGAATPVTLPWTAVDFVVTEHGVASIRGASGAARATALLAVADPSHRERLRGERRLAGRITVQ